jgi:DNA-binding winged helix-turn-helix (wHTH) protein
MHAAKSPGVICFGMYQVDLRSGELRRRGLKVRLPEQSFQILAMLLTRPGEVVSREEIRQRLWPNDTIVEFDQSINAAVKRLRQALNDSADDPRFVETLARRGYRFKFEIGSLAKQPALTATPEVVKSRPLEVPVTSEAWNDSRDRAGRTDIYSRLLAEDPEGRHGDSNEELGYAQPLKPQNNGRRTAARADTAPIAPVRNSSVRKRLLVAFSGAGVVAIVLFAYSSAVTTPPPRILSAIQLTHDGQTKLPPLFTDGTRLYFSAGPILNIHWPYQVSVAGGDPAPLARPDFAPYFYHVLSGISPDGSELLVQSVKGDFFQGPLWVLPTVAGSAHRLGGVNSSDAAWSPDGQRIAYATEHTLYLSRRDGSNSRKLVTLAQGTPWWIRWSPDERLLRFTVGNIQTNSNSLWEVHSDGSGLRPLLTDWTGSTGECCGPPGDCCGTWTRDGRYFVFQSTRNFRSDLWAIGAERELLKRSKPALVQLTNGPLNFQGPQPSYDGRKLYAVGVHARGELVRYDKKSKQLVPYLSEISADQADFSRDGQWVTYVSYPEDVLWRSRVDGSEKLRLSFAPMNIAEPHWSPDGKRIAFQAFSPGRSWAMCIIDADGTNLEEIKPWYGKINWMPGGDSVIFNTEFAVGGPGDSVAGAAFRSWT